jgi:hypothetical protein
MLWCGQAPGLARGRQGLNKIAAPRRFLQSAVRAIR